MVNQEWMDLAKIDPEFEALLKSLLQLPRVAGDIPTLRANLAERKKNLTATQQGDTSGVIEVNLLVPARDGHQIPIRVYTPEPPAKEGSPAIVYLHGGGFCLGGLENEELNCRLFVQKLGLVSVNVDYRLAPEHPFPAAINDAWDVVQWVAKNASQIGADLKRGFIVGGVSAGGNQSAAIGLLARDEKLSPPLTGLALAIPSFTDYRVIPDEYKDDIQSYEQNKDAAVIGLDSIKLFGDNYKPDLNSPLYNILTPGTKHNGLPPTFFQVCGMDPLRDEALVFERKLRAEEGTKTKLQLYPGFPHGFWSFFPDMAASRKFVQETVEGVAWLLEQGGKN